MKLFIAFATILASSEAFSPTRLYGGRTITSLSMATRVDTSDLVQIALDASKLFGATSKEAMLAWEDVEEVDSSDNSAASMGNLNGECEVEVVTPECTEYNDSLVQLQALLDANRPNLSTLAIIMTSSVNQVKLAAPSTTAAPDSPQLQAAVAEAKKITAEKGIKSGEAAVAWETVEEIAAAGNGAALGGMMTDDGCLVEAAAEACAALEALNTLISKTK